ncbi:glycosyl hydrolase family 8 [uncultured Fibrobacter sp.]|uniref:glycosyl hydrolase family 8 n=1 Tax=uncultured Fibrobacter sp. TaxID=261512 RepID=UPI0025982DEE|nr:glycosyl hydrolase family 8 [uncultured Fibrobacter sp.]
MNIKFPSILMCGALAAFCACSSDSSSSGPDQNLSSSSDASQNENPSSASTAVSLATSANALYPQALYDTWKNFHFVTEEAEALYYGSLASDFGYVFPTGGAGRVIWSAQSTGYYKEQCKVSDATESSMRFRGCTVSEGIGYGMLIAAFHNDVETFNRLWVYNKGFRTYAGTVLMPWINYSFHYNQIDYSSATDADLDIATALILMYYKTGIADYLADALVIANAIWNEEVNPSNLLLYSGNTSMWTENPTYNLSYFSPVELRLFAMIDANHDWMGVLNAGYAYMQSVQAKGTGVFPDWSDGSGSAVNPPNGSGTSTYWTFNKESVRIPWRIAWDYYWFQDERAAAVLTTLNNFIAQKSGGDPSSEALATLYSYDVSIGADITNSNIVASQWLGAWCATGIAGASSWLEACTNLLNAKSMEVSGSSYFPNILQMMYSQLLNGKYVKPF